jgi:hypothetical protein
MNTYSILFDYSNYSVANLMSDNEGFLNYSRLLTNDEHFSLIDLFLSDKQRVLKSFHLTNILVCLSPKTRLSLCTSF